MKAFLSYRRDDSQYMTDRIYDRLKQAVGKEALFRDLDNIPRGADFREIIAESLSKCEVFFAILGDRWLDMTDSSGRRRLDDHNDPVRIEVETALSRGVKVIPILIGKARIPSADALPESLRKLSYLNAAIVRPDPDFHQDMDRLMAELGLPLPEISDLNRVAGFVNQAMITVVNYAVNVINLIRSPGRFIDQKVIQEQEDIKNGLWFWVITVLLTWLVSPIFIPQASLGFIVQNAVFSVLQFAGYTSALCLAWRLVRGHADVRNMFHVTFYFWGVVEWIQVFWFSIFCGIAFAVDPELYRRFMASLLHGTGSDFTRGNLSQILTGPAIPWICAIAVIGMGALATWMCAGWGAYRRLNQVSRLRSAAAAALFVVLSLGVTGVLTLVSLAWSSFLT